MTQPATHQTELISWAAFLAMTDAEIEATFGTEADRTAIEITKDVRQLMTEENREEKKTA